MAFIDVNVKMASNDEDLCTSHADFAVICSFIEKFGEKLGLTLPNIGELQSSLEDTDNGKPRSRNGAASPPPLCLDSPPPPQAS